MKNSIEKIIKIALSRPSLFITLIVLSALSYIVYFKIEEVDKQVIYYMLQTPATLFAALNILRISSENNDEKKHKKTVYTFEFVRSWDDDNLLKARSFSREIPAKESSNYEEEEIINKIKHTPELKAAVILLFNFADSVRLGIETEILDKDIVANIASALSNILKKYEPYMRTQVWENHENVKEYEDDFDDTLKILNDLKK